MYLQGAGSEAIDGMNKQGHFETYRNPINPGKLFPTVMKEINPPADAKVVPLDLQVRTGPTVKFWSSIATANPSPATSSRGLAGRSSWEKDRLTSADGEATNLMPDEERIVMLRHDAPGTRQGRACAQG